MSHMAKRKILITGITGLLGRNLVQMLDQYEVHAIVRTAGNVPGVKYYKVDFNRDWNTDVLPKDLDIICHFSQSEEFRNFPEKAADIFKVNIDSTARLLDFAYKNKVKKFVFASSGGIYGSGINPFHENSPIPSPSSLGYYLGSKLCGEILCQNYTSMLDIIIHRFFFMYGKNQNKTMLIPRLVESVRTGQKIFLQGDSGISINPIHVTDAAQAILHSLEISGSHTFNIAGNEVLSLRSIAEMIGEKLGKTPKFEVNDTLPKSIIADNESMKALLYNPKIALSAGLMDFI